MTCYGIAVLLAGRIVVGKGLQLRGGTRLLSLQILKLLRLGELI